MGESKWRQGRSLGRTVYIQRGDDASKSDTFIGVMDTNALAALVCEAVNAYLVEHPGESAFDFLWDRERP
jgi:hypothetical protein